MADGQVIGTMVVQHRTILAEKFGEDVVNRAIGMLAPAQREAVTSAIAISWVDVEALEALYRRIGELTDADIPNLHASVARESALRTLRGIWRVLLRFTTDSALIERTPILYGKIYSKGRLTARMVSQGCAELTLSNWPEVPEFIIRSVRVAIASALEFAGRKDVRVSVSRTATDVRYDAAWRV